MYHINNLKVKGLRVLLHYHSRSEKLNRIRKKLELLGAVTYFFKLLVGYCAEEGGGGGSGL